MKPIAINSRLEMLYLLALVCGLRRGELIALRWEDVNWTKELLSIAESIDKRGRPGDTKGRRSRVVSISGVIPALKAHQTKMELEGFAGDKDFLFTSTVGTALNPRNLDDHFKSVLAAAGLPSSIRFHDLRHSAGSLMLAAGSQLTDVSHILGHASPVITGKVYAHSYQDNRKKAAVSVSGLLQQKEPDGASKG